MGKVKEVIVSIVGGFMSLLGVLATPVLILAGNLTDYITGLPAAGQLQRVSRDQKK